MNGDDVNGGEQLEWGWGQEEEQKNFSSHILADAEDDVTPTASVADSEGFGIGEFIRGEIVGGVIGGAVEGVVEGLFDVGGN